MVEKTPRLDLDNYEVGDQNWDHSDTVEAVDRYAVQRGPIADRPSEGQYDDELYMATDQNVLWRWDGGESDWIPTGGTGAASRPLESVHANELNETHVLDPEEDVKHELSQRLDYDGASIELRAGTEYVLEEDNVVVDSDDVSIRGPPSAVVKLADETVDDDSSTAVIEFRGSGGTLEGWTFDGNVHNQGATDRYGLKWADGATDWDVRGHRNFRACGDAYGNVRDGLRMINCVAKGFTEDGIDYWASGETGVLLGNCHFEGRFPIKVRHRGYRSEIDGQGGLQATNCRFHGDDPTEEGEGSYAVLFRNALDGYVMEDFTFTNCHFSRSDESNWVINFSGKPDEYGTVRNVEFAGCTARARRVLRSHPDRPVAVENLRIVGGRFHNNDNSDRVIQLHGPVTGVVVSRTELESDKGGEYVTLDEEVTDVNVDAEVSEIRSNGASNVRYRDVLGGGPLGGVDLTSTTGYADGQEAESDGSASEFPRGTRAVWDDADGRWVRIDGQATVSPTETTG